MMIGTGRDMFWSDYKKYGYTEADFDDDSDVVSEAEWEEVKENSSGLTRLLEKEEG